ncbi:14030_t:CDS:2 [Funneliformis geosporum]|uniref:14321_t:CDS:1 n=1 Tax=Funneliformis geosporum TaxID=1117311 RepID=A0A9W4WY43_9GLOM|nr:14030_t:CDS:2 [Funneliformis geosporum]CAI2172245.1 14321_t:CDS:2 [Funneliformis geosporum]
MSKLPTNATTYKLHAPNYVSSLSDNNNETIDKYMIHSPTFPAPVKSSKKSISNLSFSSINNNNGIKQRKSIKFQPEDDNKFSTRLGKNFINLINSIHKKLSRIIELMTYLRLILALTLYSLVLVDVIHIHEKKEKKFWIEIFTQAINAAFIFLTIVGHPKRLRNLPRAIRISWVVMKGKMSTINSYLSTYTEIQKTQINVARDYKWYVYDTLDSSLNCTPIKLLSILLIWNIGTLAQYGISGILWFIPQSKRPEIPYLILTIITSVSEFLPIPAVVIQSKRARMAHNYEIRYTFRYSIQDSC